MFLTRPVDPCFLRSKIVKGIFFFSQTPFWAIWNSLMLVSAVELCLVWLTLSWTKTLLCFIIWLVPWAGRMNQIARCDWLPERERARWSYLARSGLPTLSRKKNFSKGQIINPLLTKRVGSRWLDIGQVLFLASLWTETESRSINTKILKLPSLRSFVLLLPGDRN